MWHDFERSDWQFLPCLIEGKSRELVAKIDSKIVSISGWWFSLIFP
jgi:hypothetical protein